MADLESVRLKLEEAQSTLQDVQKAFQEIAAKSDATSSNPHVRVGKLDPNLDELNRGLEGDIERSSLPDWQPDIRTDDLLVQLNSIQRLIELPWPKPMAPTEWEATLWQLHTDLGILIDEFISDQLIKNQDVPKLPSWNMTFKYTTKLANIGLPILLNRQIEEIDNVDIRVHLFRNQTEVKLLVDTLDGLNPTESRLVQLKYGLADGTCRTLEETARDLGMTSEQTNQIEIAALRHLRNLWAHPGLFTTNPSSASRITDFFQRLKRLQDAWKMLQRFYLVETIGSPTPKQSILALQSSKTQSSVSRMVSAATEIFEDALIHKLLTQQHPDFETQINSGFGGRHRYLLKKKSGVDKDSFELKCSVTLITERSRSLPGKIQDALINMVSDFEEDNLGSNSTPTVHGLLIPQAPTVPLAPHDLNGRFSHPFISKFTTNASRITNFFQGRGNLDFIDRDKLRREVESMGQNDSRREVLKRFQEILAKSDALSEKFNPWDKIRDLDPDKLVRTLESITLDVHYPPDTPDGHKLGTTIYFFDHMVSLEDIPTTRNINTLCNWIMKNSTPDVSKFEEHTVARYVVRYVGDHSGLDETLTHVQLVRRANRVRYLVRCPFCSDSMIELGHLSKKRKELRYKCENGHRVGLVSGRDGMMGWM